MRILHRYLIRDFTLSFLATCSVLTFVMCLGALFKSIDLLAQGGDAARLIGLMILYSLPYIATFSIPLSGLMACLLVFGRLSIDGEVTALRSSGFSIWQIAAPVIFMSIVLSAVCLYLNYQVSPDSYTKRRELLAKQSPTTLLQTGEFNEFGTYQIRFQEKQGDNVYDVTLHEMKDKVLQSEVDALDGVIVMDTSNKVLVLELNQCIVDERGEENPYQTERLEFSIGLEELFGTKSKKMKGRTFSELKECIVSPNTVYSELNVRNPDHKIKLAQYKQEAMIEMNKRIVLSLSCFAFILLAIPMGMKSKRKESPVGFFMALFVAVGFYAFVILADALQKRPDLYPDTLLWIPLVVGQVIGFILLKRIQ